MIIATKDYLYLYQSDNNIKQSIKEILGYYVGKGLNRDEVHKDLIHIKKDGLYRFHIETAPYTFNHWGDTLVDYEDILVSTDLSELVEFINILDMFK